jgi:hypothetical protein
METPQKSRPIFFVRSKATEVLLVLREEHELKTPEWRPFHEEAEAVPVESGVFCRSGGQKVIFLH